MCPVYFYTKGKDLYNEKAENGEGNSADNHAAFLYKRGFLYIFGM